jgi:hypothetical protein
VLPLLIKPIRVLLDHRSARLSMGDLSADQRQTISKNKTGDFNGAIHALDELLKLVAVNKTIFGFAKRPWIVVIQQSWTRNFCCFWHPTLISVKEFEKLAFLEFERRFALDASQWDIQLENPVPNRQSLFCAFPSEQNQRIDQIFLAHKLPFLSLRSFAFAELDLAFKSIQNPSNKMQQIQFLGSGELIKPALFIDKGRITEFQMVPASVTTLNPSHNDKLTQILCANNAVNGNKYLARLQVLHSTEEMQTQVLNGIAKNGNVRLDKVMESI